MKRIVCSLLLVSALIVLTGWGSAGHRRINEGSVLSFLPAMSSYLVWEDDLGDHASDADYRKDIDPDEAPKHYIDIDEYPMFAQQGRIPSTLDSVIALYGSYFVYGKGILPWATEAAFDTLKNTFLRADWNKAILTASDLGHYVADGHMPLHITGNYNGQQSGNYGIHSRYESSMLGSYIDDIVMTGADTLHYVSDIRKYVFTYLYRNYPYVDSVLQADNYARGVAGGTSGSAYYQALWLRTGSFTTTLFNQAAVSLAEMIYTAWYEAGYPVYYPASAEEAGNDAPLGLSVWTGSGKSIVLCNTSEQDVVVAVYDLSGRLLLPVFEIPGVRNASTRVLQIPVMNSGVVIVRAACSDKTTAIRVLIP